MHPHRVVSARLRQPVVKINVESVEVFTEQGPAVPLCGPLPEHVAACTSLLACVALFEATVGIGNRLARFALGRADIVM